MRAADEWIGAREGLRYVLLGLGHELCDVFPGVRDVGLVGCACTVRGVELRFVFPVFCALAWEWNDLVRWRGVSFSCACTKMVLEVVLRMDGTRLGYSCVYTRRLRLYVGRCGCIVSDL